MPFRLGHGTFTPHREVSPHVLGRKVHDRSICLPQVPGNNTLPACARMKMSLSGEIQFLWSYAVPYFAAIRGFRSAPDQGSLSGDPKLRGGAERKVHDRLECSQDAETDSHSSN